MKSIANRLASGLFLSAFVWMGCVGLAAAGVWGYWQGQGDRAYFVDEGIYTYLGWSWLQGDWPYRDIWDHKGPLVHLTTMIRTALGGTSARILGAQEIALGVTTAILLSGIATLLWGGLALPIALALGILVWAQRPLVDFGTATVDPAHVHMSTPGSLIALFSTAAVLCALAAVRRAGFARAALLAFLSGICAGLALSTKLNAVAGFVVALAVLVAGERQRSVVQRAWLGGLSILGATVPLAAFAITFRAAGALREFVDAYFVFNSIRGGLGFAPKDWLFLPIQVARNLNYAGIATITLVVLVAGAVAVVRGQLSNTAPGLVLKGCELLVPAWLLLEILVWLSNGGAYAFRVYPVLPAAALGVTWLVLAPMRDRQMGGVWSMIVFLLVAVPAVLTLDPLHARARQVTVEWNKVVRDLAATTGDSDRVLSLNSWRAPSIMSLVQRRSSSRYVFPPPLSTLHYASDARWAEILESVQGETAPRVILLGRSSDVPPGDSAPAIERALRSLDQPDLRSALVDHTAFPSLERLKIAIAGRYRLTYCADEVCVLRRLD